MRYELTITQKAKSDDSLLQEFKSINDTKEEVLDRILSLSKQAKDYQATYLLFEMKEVE